MRVPRSVTAALAASLVVPFRLAAARAQEKATGVGTDIGTLYEDQAAPIFKKPGYSPYAGRH